MLCDFHLHTEFSGDSETPVRDQTERAIALGMKEICITDHHDYDALEAGEDILCCQMPASSIALATLTISAARRLSLWTHRARS